ncbi:YtzC family protein [Niallia sp. XMNu-256]|uniref:YtzC family protein n=1 Tax=Niallia sp. XMNu-256 TaxID=3082444 RepID=UPI0030CEECF4
MATRDSMNELKQQCEDVLRFANDQYQESSLQQQYNDDNYIQSLQQLEKAYNDIAIMAHSANGQQREELHRLRLQIQQAQNKMILLQH